ncbi:E3 ubiquitin-protein ligase pub1 [Coemansia sp. RSA 1250]|nr:E3 ubiquitin-protein ligase pub1 [Coemansia sp. RSA 1250]
MKLVAQGIAAAAFVVMLHSGYSAREYLLYSKSIGRQDLALPLEIVLECLASLLIMTVALVIGVGELKPISYEAEMKRYSIDGVFSRPSFQVFNHRGRYLRPLRTLFEDRSAYGIPVKCSRHPELNKYIADVVLAIKAELEKNKPGDVMIRIHDDDGNSIEEFVLEMSAVAGNYEPSHDVELRSALIRLSTLEDAPALRDDATFEVCFRTRDGSAPSLEANAWVPRLDKTGVTDGASPPNEPSRLVPLSSIDSAELKMMEGPPASATGNGASANGIYAAQQHSPGQQVPLAMNGGSAQFPGMAPTPQNSDDLPNSSKSLYVGNLDPQVTEQTLYEVFASVRPVMGVKIIADKRQAGGLNYGFVEFANHQDAEFALQSLNGHRILENDIRVNWAFTSGTPSHEDTSNHFPIFVGDLSSEVNDQVLAKAFSIFPSMSDARVMWDMTSGKSRGYGFVSFRDRADAEKAVSQMNGEWLGSRAIRVNWANQKAAKPRHDNQPSQPLSYEAVRDQTAQYNTTVYVGNLTNYTTQEQLQALFQPYGFVLELRMQVDRGFAFVKMDTHENAAMSITQLHGMSLNGRLLKCSWGKDRLTDPKAAFGAIAAAAAANPAYTYPYVYGMPQQQFNVAGSNQQQPPPPANNPQGWNNFAYESYGAYYGNPGYPQPGQMVHPGALNGAPNAGPGAMPATPHDSQSPEGSY